MNFGEQANQRYSRATSLVKQGRKYVLQQVAENYVRRLLTSETKQKCCNSTHSLTIADFIEASCNRVEDVGNIEPGGMLVMHVLLDDIEELFHRIVENIEVGSSTNNVLSYDFHFFTEFIGTLVKQSQEVIVLIVFLLKFFTILDG